MFMLQSYGKFIEKHTFLNKNIQIYLKIISNSYILVAFLFKS